MDDQGYPGKSSGNKLVGNQDPIDSHCTKHTS